MNINKISNGFSRVFFTKRIVLGVISLVLIFSSLAVSPTTTQAQTAPLPVISGLWSPQWLATYQRMRTENHVWWTLINNNCALSGTSGQRYSDNGMWCTIVYKVTGDTVAAQKAATRWLAANPQVANDNHRQGMHVSFESG